MAWEMYGMMLLGTIILKDVVAQRLELKTVQDWVSCAAYYIRDFSFSKHQNRIAVYPKPYKNLIKTVELKYRYILKK